MCDKNILNIFRMENSVLGNALEGVPQEEEGEEDEEAEQKPKESNVEGTENIDGGKCQPNNNPEVFFLCLVTE